MDLGSFLLIPAVHWLEIEELCPSLASRMVQTLWMTGGRLVIRAAVAAP
jgi:hypothetical protein